MRVENLSVDVASKHLDVCMHDEIGDVILTLSICNTCDIRDHQIFQLYFKYSTFSTYAAKL